MPARNKPSRKKPTRRPSRLKLIDEKSAMEMIPFTLKPDPDRRMRAGVGADGSTRPRAPTAPRWFKDEPRRIWRRSVRAMIEAGTWQPLFESHLSVYCHLLSEFEADPAGFQATKLTTLRLYAGDLGLSPTTVDKVVRIKRR